MSPAIATHRIENLQKLAPQPIATPQAAAHTAAPAPIASFAEVFRAHAGYVLGLLRHLGVRDADLEDIAQEVFVVVHGRLESFEGRSSLRTWLCGIALRKASEYRRRAYQRREQLGDGAEGGELRSPELHAADPERLLEQSRAARRLQLALASLPEKQLQVFVLFEIEELSMSEVAAAVGCPRFTAYTRLYAARKAVRAFYAAEMVEKQKP